MDISKILARLIQVGTVTDVDTAKRMARVKFPDTGITSAWLYVIQRHDASLYIEPDGGHTHEIRDTFTGGGSARMEPDHNHTRSHVTYWMPKVNDTVLVVYLPVRDGDGFVIGGI